MHTPEDLEKARASVRDITAECVDLTKRITKFNQLVETRLAEVQHVRGDKGEEDQTLATNSLLAMVKLREVMQETLS